MTSRTRFLTQPMTYTYSFYDDYSEGAHPQIVAALTRTNLSQEPGYGKDSLCQEAVRLLREKVGNPDADIHFVVTGTQANLIACAAMLRPYESVIAPVSGHIATHEAGAVEATGHKINAIPTAQGRLSCPDIEQVVQDTPMSTWSNPGPCSLLTPPRSARFIPKPSSTHSPNFAVRSSSIFIWTAHG